MLDIIKRKETKNKSCCNIKNKILSYNINQPLLQNSPILNQHQIVSNDKEDLFNLPNTDKKQEIEIKNNELLLEEQKRFSNNSPNNILNNNVIIQNNDNNIKKNSFSCQCKSSSCYNKRCSCFKNKVLCNENCRCNKMLCKILQKSNN